MRKYVIGLLIGCFCLPLQAQKQPITIVSYNVENLFDTTPDTIGNISVAEAKDKEYTVEGDRHWNYSKYQNKLNHIAQVIANIGGWNIPAIVGLLEVENAQCLQDLTRYHMRNYGYQFLHKDGPDMRGIDCALLYNPKQFRLLDSAFIHVPLVNRPTRDIVYAEGVVNRHDTLHIYLCHMPSQLGGTQATQQRRDIAFATLQQHIDSVFLASPQANVIVMGDMNQVPQNNLKGMQNRMLHQPVPLGTHKYKGKWSMLDQFYTAGTLLDSAEVHVFMPDWLLEDDPIGDKRPKRTYQGFKYQADGFSDHLPIYMVLP